MFYEDDEIMHRESEILEAAYFKSQALKNPQAIRYLKEGLTRRLYMMRASRILFREKARPDRKKTLPTYLVTELAIHINAYYLNLCGSLDNMAWIMAYEWAMLPGIDEGNSASRQYCNLFGKNFRRDLRQIRNGLADLLDEYFEWNRELRNFRGPAAHRIPLYVAPGVMRDRETLERFYEIGKEAEKSEEARSGRSLSEIFEEQRGVAGYEPIITTASVNGLEEHSIPEQVGMDHQMFLKIAGAIMNAL
jgi:hypothetical protein